MLPGHGDFLPKDNGDKPDAVIDAQRFVHDDYKDCYERCMAEISALFTKAFAYGNPDNLAEVAAAFDDLLSDSISEPVKRAQDIAEEHGWEAKVYNSPLAVEGRNLKTERMLLQRAQREAKRSQSGDALFNLLKNISRPYPVNPATHNTVDQINKQITSAFSTSNGSAQVRESDNEA